MLNPFFFLKQFYLSALIKHFNTIHSLLYELAIKRNYGANEILICTPALVLVVGALDEIYGFTLRWS